MTFNEAAFKKQWRTLCKAAHIDPEEGVQQPLSIYQLCNVRAALHSLADNLRTWLPRCDHPDDGQFFFEDRINRPMEAPSEIEIWDIIGMEMVREAWRDAREEAPLAKIHDVQAKREIEMMVG